MKEKEQGIKQGQTGGEMKMKGKKEKRDKKGKRINEVKKKRRKQTGEG